ncbi:MAG: hypothetical protein PUF12_05885 [Thermoflexaceae bacterium]|nr:hypothetical protein [Thermoflexaceae bacterium]
MKTIEKGQYGYVEYRKKIQLIKVSVAFLVVFAILIFGILVCGTKNNICTVISVVCVLPAARFAVTLFMVIRHKTPDAAQYEELKEKGEQLVLLSDCIMSCREKVIYVEFAIITDTCIYCYTRNQDFDVNYFENGIADFIKSCGDTVNVKLFKNYEDFKKRAIALNGMEYKEKKAERIKNDFLILVI